MKSTYMLFNLMTSPLAMLVLLSPMNKNTSFWEEWTWMVCWVWNIFLPQPPSWSRRWSLWRKKNLLRSWRSTLPTLPMTVTSPPPTTTSINVWLRWLQLILVLEKESRRSCRPKLTENRTRSTPRWRSDLLILMIPIWPPKSNMNTTRLSIGHCKSKLKLVWLLTTLLTHQ